MKYFKIWCAVACLLLVVIGSSLLIPSHASAAYIGGRLIDDAVFLNSASMTPAQIQAFLGGKGSYLTNYNTVETLDTYPNFGKNVPASQVIYDAAQVYGLNPQAILATLQKEESLVTDPSPSNGQINFAMGYGCADSTGCSKYSGFYNQVDNGTWQLRFNYERAHGNNSWWNASLSYPCGSATRYYTPGLYAGNTVTFKDDYGTAYASFVIENGSTAALYCYTPHAYPGSAQQYFSGSYNFVLVFEQWFGPTAGTILLKGSGPTIYLGYAGVRYAIPSAGVLAAYGLSSYGITPTSDSYLNSLTDGGILTNNFMIQGDSTVYLADSGKRYGIPSASTCTNWGLDCFHNVATLNPALVGLFAPSGTLQPLMNYQGTVYLMNNGTKQPFLSPGALSEHGFGWSNVDDIGSSINATQTIGTSFPQNNSLVKFASSPTFYYYSGGVFYTVPSLDSYKSWFSSQDPIFIDALSSYNTALPTSAGSLPYLFTYNSKKYLVDQYRKLDLSNVSSSWPTASDASFLGPLIDRLPTVAVATRNTWRLPTGSILKVTNGQMRYFNSWGDFLADGNLPQDVISVFPEAVTGLTQGQNILGPAALVKGSSSSTIFVVGSNNNSYSLTSMSDIFAFRLDTNRAGTVDPQTFSFYTQTTTALPYLAKDSSGVNSLVTADAWRLTATTSVLSAWGLTTNQFLPIDDVLLARVPQSAVSPTFASYNGTIYYGTGGQRHALSSYAKYLSLGGNSTNTFSANQSFIAATPLGSSL